MYDQANKRMIFSRALAEGLGELRRLPLPARGEEGELGRVQAIIILLYYYVILYYNMFYVIT